MKVVHIKRNDEIDITFCDQMAGSDAMFDDEEIPMNLTTCRDCSEAYEKHCDDLDALRHARIAAL